MQTNLEKRRTNYKRARYMCASVQFLPSSLLLFCCVLVSAKMSSIQCVWPIFGGAAINHMHTHVVIVRTIYTPRYHFCHAYEPLARGDDDRWMYIFGVQHLVVVVQKMCGQGFYYEFLNKLFLQGWCFQASRAILIYFDYFKFWK